MIMTRINLLPWREEHRQEQKKQLYLSVFWPQRLSV